MSYVRARLTEAQVATILTQYDAKKLSTADAQAKLGLKRSRFFDYVKAFRKDASSFSIVQTPHQRKSRIPEDTEKHIKEELGKEKDLIEDPSIPIRWYNYSAVRDELKEVLRHLVDSYNTRWVHSTTQEIPIVRFEKALNGNCSLFKPLAVAAPGKDQNDLFCLSFKRTTDGYRSLSFDSICFRLLNGKSYTDTEIHLAFDPKSGLVVARFWQRGSFVEEHKIKMSQLKTVRF